MRQINLYYKPAGYLFDINVGALSYDDDDCYVDDDSYYKFPFNLDEIAEETDKKAAQSCSSSSCNSGSCSNQSQESTKEDVKIQNQSKDDSGAVCKKCNQYNPYASSNCSDGSFVCYSCRQC